jgi:hypothetical protein
MPKDKVKETVIIDIEKFVLFHKSRVSLSKEFAKNKSHGRLIFQIAFLGFESLAKLLYPNMESGKRFIELLSLPNGGLEKKKLLFCIRIGEILSSIKDSLQILGQRWKCGVNMILHFCPIKKMN